MAAHTAPPHHKPVGIWGALDRVSSQARATGAGVYCALSTRSAATSGRLWQKLAERADLAQYCPHALPGIAEEQVREGAQVFTVIRSQRGNYLRLTPEQRTLWQQMDGTRTVAELATQAFIQFHQLLPVGDLVTAFKQEGFLRDQPIGVYRAVAARLEAHTAASWGQRVLHFLTGQRFSLRNIDRRYTLIYRTIGWLFFTPLFATLWVIVVALGGVAFVQLFSVPAATQATTGGLPLQIASLWVALLISFLLHESAHALAVKHFGRTLRGGGVMLYFAAPAFYVDTSDIWRSPRRARVLVSAAGPMSDLFIGGLASAYALFQPDALLAPVAAKLAITCYVATLFNLNPLLELDGYYILVDVLRLPDLRRRALAFICGPLWQKGAQKNDQGRMALQPFTREERIFTLYGALTALYAVVALVFAFQFWRRWLWGTIVHLWTLGGWLNQIGAAALVLLVVAPILAGLAFVVGGSVRTAVAWLIRRGYGRRPGLIAMVSGALVLLLALGVGRGEASSILRAVPLLLWIIAAAALLAVRPDYQGAAIDMALRALLPATVLAGLAAALRGALPTAWLWQAADGLALLFLLLAAFAAQLEVNLRQSPVREQLISTLMLMLAFFVGGAVVARQIVDSAATAPGLLASATPAALIVGAPAYFGALALALLLPYLFSLSDSRLIWSWGLLWAAALLETTAYVVDLRTPSLGLDILSSGLWAAAWITHLATIRQIAPGELTWELTPSTSEHERLARAFQLCYAGCYQTLRAVYGARRTRELDDRMDVIAATANWDVTLDRDTARVGALLAASPLDLQGARFAEVLRYTVATIEQIAGATFARRVIQAAYDALPWQERETASRLCFPDTPWARALSGMFGDAQAGRLRLLRDVDALMDIDDAALATFARSAQPMQFKAGQLILRAGEQAAGLWVVEAGEVLAKRGQAAIRELHRAGTFGIDELTSGEPSACTYRASVDSALLFVPSSDLQPFIGALGTAASSALAANATARLLERVSIFAQLSRHTLRGLAQIAVARQFAAREIIIRQNVASGALYVIQHGHAAVLTRSMPNSALAVAGSTAKSAITIIARLGPEEFFGEMELLDGTPPRAHVVAETALTALVLPHDTVRALLLGNGTLAKGLEQISSARRRDLATIAQ